MSRQASAPQTPVDQPGLKRDMGLVSATVLVVASMIGTGIFTTSGFIMSSLRSPQAMLLCWFAGGILALSGAFCYGELGAMFPRAGGDYVFLRESLERVMGFLSGWISLIVGFSAPIAAAAMAFSSYFFHSLPAGARGWTSLFLSKTGPRVYYAMAEDGIFFSWFGKVGKRPATPGRSIFLQAAIAVLMVITSAFDKFLLYIRFHAVPFRHVDGGGPACPALQVSRLHPSLPDLWIPCYAASFYAGQSLDHHLFSSKQPHGFPVRRRHHPGRPFDLLFLQPNRPQADRSRRRFFRDLGSNGLRPLLP